MHDRETVRAVAGGQAPGLAVDAGGGPIVDPSENVKSLSEAANKRQDDLREETNLRVNEAIAHLKEMASLRAYYEDKLAIAEAKRIDAIRAVDVNAVAVASQRAADQATVLATQVQQSAETLRTALTNTATTIAAQMDSKFAGIVERISALEKAQYEGKGRSSYSDPQLMELTSAVRGLQEAGASGSGKGAGSEAAKAATRATIATIVGIGTMLIGLVAFFLRFATK